MRIILTKDKDHLKKLAEDSTSGGCIAVANFAIMHTNHKYGFHLFDSGRVLQNMQLSASI